MMLTVGDDVFRVQHTFPKMEKIHSPGWMSKKGNSGVSNEKNHEK
jgi:hypothetical protein